MANYLEINKCATQDGPGVRVSVYFQGCPLHCPGCHNVISWDPEFGMAFTDDTISEIVEAADSDYIAGLSILGGEPLANYNLESTRKLITEFRKRHPGKSIWIWTGYEWNELRDRLLARSADGQRLHYILVNADVAVIGRFELDKRDITKENLWRGSTNQRIILTQESLRTNSIIYMPNIPNNN